MFSTVTPSRHGRQLSSSVSTETIRRTDRDMREPSGGCWCRRATVAPAARSQPRPQPARQVEAAEPLTPPARSERDELSRHAPQRRPLQLVRLLAAQEVEAPVAPLDRATDHVRHEDGAQAQGVASRFESAWVEGTG